MNKKVRKYTPLLLPHQAKRIHSPTSSTLSAPIKHWRQYLKPQVNQHYLQIMNKKRQTKSPRYTARQGQKSVVSVYSPNNSYLEKSYLQKSQVKSHSTQWQLMTPQKYSAYNNSSISTTIPRGELSHREMSRKQEYSQVQRQQSQRQKLIEQECLYLRKHFISHCMLKHKPQFIS